MIYKNFVKLFIEILENLARFNKNVYKNRDFIK